MNIIGYVPFLFNTLETLVRGWKYTKLSSLAVVSFFMLSACVVFVNVESFPFISNFRFGYFLFSKFLLGYNWYLEN